jgi:hypothetical protein
MSSDSGGDAGSSSQEAANFDDYDTGSVTANYSGGSPAYSGGSTYDEAGVDSFTNNSYGGGSPAYSGGGSDTVSVSDVVGGSDIDSTYNASDAYFTPTQAEPTFAENVIGGVTDYVKGGGLIGMGIRAAQDVFGTPENQYAGIEGEDGYGEGDYVSTVGDWAESRGLTTDYSSEDLETQQVLDQQAFDAGFRSQSFNDLYQTGDTQNIQNLNQPESNLVKQLIPQAPFLVSGGQAPQSMVNDYFANIGGQSGLSNDLQTDYDAAKASVAQTLAINPLAQQFGYSTAPYGALTAQNTGTNPFNIPYLQTRGLI